MRLIQDLISLGLGFISNENDGVERRAKTPLTPAVYNRSRSKSRVFSEELDIQQYFILFLNI